MDSPAARQRGQYNWASTLWHELAHAFHLAMTDHRVPRWFSEGLAVHEQRKAREGWGHQPTIPFLQALAEGRLKRVSELNDGFMRPEYPEQVVHSYYQASLVFQVLEERYGFDTIRAFLAGYLRGQGTEALFASVLGLPLEDFDDEFDDYLRERFREPLRGLVRLGGAPPAQAGISALEDYVRSHPGDYLGRLRLGASLVREGRLAEARPHLTEALRMFPEYGGPDSPYVFLARIPLAEGDPERAAAALARLNALSESNHGALVEEAEIQESLGRTEAAAKALEKALHVYPYDIEPHESLADAAHRLGNHEIAVRERRAVVALEPADRAEALYLLARAQRDAGDRTGARRTVLQALDVAPNFDAALELLLELRGGTEDGR
jgi:Flp pilus assembly protein TadD